MMAAGPFYMKREKHKGIDSRTIKPPVYGLPAALGVIKSRGLLYQKLVTLSSSSGLTL